MNRSLVLLIAMASFGCGDKLRPTDPTPFDPPTIEAERARPFPMGFGYFRAISKYGDYSSEIRCYTDTVHLGYWDFDGRLDAIAQALVTAKAQGFKIIYEMHQDPGAAGKMIAAAAPVWDAVIAVDAVDEPSTKNLDRWLGEVRTAIERAGLSPRPIGVTTQYGVATSESIGYTEGLDWIGIEGYVEPGQFGAPEDNADILRDHLSRAIANIPPHVDIVIVGMGYSRNFHISDITALAKLQEVTFEYAQDEPRVQGISFFSYGRPSGTRDYPELKAAHKASAKLLGINTCGN